jgi:hypothetical protein
VPQGGWVDLLLLLLLRQRRRWRRLLLLLLLLLLMVQFNTRSMMRGLLSESTTLFFDSGTLSQQVNSSPYMCLTTHSLPHHGWACRAERTGHGHEQPGHSGGRD